MDADIGVRVSTHLTDARTGTRCRWYTRLAAEFTCPPAQARWWGDRDPATIGLSFGRDRTIVAEDLDDPAAAMAAVDAHIATRDARGTQQRRMPGTRSHRHHARRAPERRLEGSARASPTAGSETAVVAHEPSALSTLRRDRQWATKRVPKLQRCDLTERHWG
jgi:hypothetical protein